MALAASPLHVLGVRLLDRAGKGVRGAPRDALLAAAVPASQRGRAFGFHRAMDHAGATLGPLLASAALLAGADLRTVFALAAVPGFVALAVLVFAVEERPRDEAPPEAPPPSPFRAGTASDLRRFLALLALFTLGNSSDAFLLLRAQELGVALAFVPLLWTFHHLVKAGLSTWGGAFSDRAGRRRAIAAGWGVYALAYLGFACATGPWAIVALFGFYGLFPALTEGPEKALVADLAGTSARGRAFGAYHAVTGFVVLPGNLLTGWLWETAGATTALGLGAALATVAAFLLATVVGEPPGDAVPFDRATSSD
jgi:MFS family permease